MVHRDIIYRKYNQEALLTSHVEMIHPSSHVEMVHPSQGVEEPIKPTVSKVETISVEERTTNDDIIQSDISSTTSGSSIDGTNDENNVIDLDIEHEQESTEQVPLSKLLIFAFLPLIFSAAFNFIHAILNPLQIMTIVGNEHKSYVLSIVGSITGASAMITGPIVGHISDHIKTPYGSRLPGILIGCIFFGLTFLARIFLELPGNISVLIVAVFFCTLAEVAAQTVWSCYYGLFNDLFPVNQIGILSGLNSFMITLSTLLGVAFFGFIYANLIPGFIIMILLAIALLATGLLYMFLFKEPSSHYHSSIFFDLSSFRAQSEQIKAMSRNLTTKTLEEKSCQEDSNATLLHNNISHEPEQQYSTKQIICVEPQSEPDSNHNMGQAFNNSKEEHYQLESKNHFSTLFQINNKWLYRLKGILYFLRDFFYPFKNWDFVWLCISRACFALAIGLVQMYGLFYFKDKIGPHGYTLFGNDELIKDAEQAQAVFVMVNVFNALVSAVVGGYLSDRIGRRPLVTISSLLLFVGCMGMSFSKKFSSIIFYGIPIGIGLGGFYSSDLALANAVIDKKESAKGLSLFHLSHNFPLMLSSPVGGLLFLLGEYLNSRHLVTIPHFGYNIMCLFCATLCLLSGLLVWLIRDVESFPNSLLIRKMTEFLTNLILRIGNHTKDYIPEELKDVYPDRKSVV